MNREEGKRNDWKKEALVKETQSRSVQADWKIHKDIRTISNFNRFTRGTMSWTQRLDTVTWTVNKVKWMNERKRQINKWINTAVQQKMRNMINIWKNENGKQISEAKK